MLISLIYHQLFIDFSIYKLNKNLPHSRPPPRRCYLHRCNIWSTLPVGVVGCCWETLGGLHWPSSWRYYSCSMSCGEGPLVGGSAKEPLSRVVGPLCSCCFGMRLWPTFERRNSRILRRGIRVDDASWWLMTTCCLSLVVVLRVVVGLRVKKKGNGEKVKNIYFS